MKASVSTRKRRLKHLVKKVCDGKGGVGITSPLTSSQIKKYTTLGIKPNAQNPLGGTTIRGKAKKLKAFKKAVLKKLVLKKLPKVAKFKAAKKPKIAAIKQIIKRR
jgi:hypothetical protein